MVVARKTGGSETPPLRQGGGWGVGASRPEEAGLRPASTKIRTRDQAD